MIEYVNYDRAILVTSDGDFGCLAEYLYGKEKLKVVLSPHHKTCSILLKKTAKEKIVFLDNLEQKLGQKKKHRVGTYPLRSAFSCEFTSVKQTVFICQIFMV